MVAFFINDLWFVEADPTAALSDLSSGRGSLTICLVQGREGGNLTEKIILPDFSRRLNAVLLFLLTCSGLVISQKALGFQLQNGCSLEKDPLMLVHNVACMGRRHHASHSVQRPYILGVSSTSVRQGAQE